MNFNRKLPIGVQSFKVIRDDNYLHADKTRLIYKLASSGQVYFSSAGAISEKVFFLQHYKHIFLGQKELFSGLHIEELENAQSNPWQEYPVFYLDFNVGKYDCIEALNETLHLFLTEQGAKYNMLSYDIVLCKTFCSIIKNR